MVTRHYEETPHHGLTDDAYIEILVALDAEPERLAPLLESLHPADIADLIERLPREHREAVITSTPPEHLSEVISHLEDGVKEHVVQFLNPQQVAAALTELESDDAADLAQMIEDMSEDEDADAEDFLTDPQQKHLLEFEEDTAGALMQQEVLAALPTDTVTQFLEYMRANGDNLSANPGSIFVVNRQRRLLGTISMGRIVKAPLKAKLEDVMRRDPLTVLPEAPTDQVVRIFEKYDIHNLAVVNKRNQLLGRVTIDDVLDTVMDDHAYRQSAAAGVDSDEDLFAPVLTTARTRLPWLIINLFTAIAAAAVISLFEDSIAKLTTLAVLMPIIASSGGNATTQTQTVIIRGLATGHITKQNAWALFRKEFASGNLNGIVIAVALALGVLVIFQSPMLSCVILMATVANHAIAAFGGWVTPLVLKRYNYDPAISTGVITTTFTDVGGFFVFLSLATLLLL
ncbi:MAG: magnesium transporter [Alphaproteobacteria bacterium]|nr:MAG: magnesium transporter [Alphaproteobacteria bacterium]